MKKLNNPICIKIKSYIIAIIGTSYNNNIMFKARNKINKL